MSYTQWFEAHAKKHEKIVAKLQVQGLDEDAVIAYFDYDTMRLKEADFCPLYAENKKCHDMEKLNCYLCACPNFRFQDSGIDKLEGKTRFSLCAIDSKEGKAGVYGEAVHQDCSKCSVPHHHKYVKEHFRWSWREIMSQCRL